MDTPRPRTREEAERLLDANFHGKEAIIQQIRTHLLNFHKVSSLLDAAEDKATAELLYEVWEDVERELWDRLENNISRGTELAAYRNQLG